jgi:hypothetical protein
MPLLTHLLIINAAQERKATGASRGSNTGKQRGTIEC